MKKEFEVHVYCNGVEYTPTTNYINSSVRYPYLELELKNNDEIIGTALNLIYTKDRLFRKASDFKFIWYNKIVNVKILYDNKVVLDTREEKHDMFQPLLKFNSSYTSKKRYAQILLYLSDLSDSNIQLSHKDDKYINEVNHILKSIQNVNDFKDFKYNYNDYQLAVLCRGMSESGPRALAEQYFKNNFWSVMEKKTARGYVNTAVSKYGIDFLDYCLQLPRKPFKIHNVRRVFREFEKTKLSKPVIRVAIGGREINLYYNTKTQKINIKNDSEQSICKLDKSGVVSNIGTTDNFNVSIALLLAFSDNPLKQILYYGSQTGRCSFCAKELSDPISTNYGYGKTCAGNYDLPWG